VGGGGWGGGGGGGGGGGREEETSCQFIQKRPIHVTLLSSKMTWGLQAGGGAELPLHCDMTNSYT